MHVGYFFGTGFALLQSNNKQHITSMKNKKKLSAIISKLEGIFSELETLKEEEEEARDALQDKYDNKSEKWQESEAGNAMYDKIESWNSEISDLEDAFNELESCTSSLGNIELE